MQLRRLTGLEREAIESELKELLEMIKKFEAILADEKEILAFLVTDFGAASTEVRVENYKEKRLNEVFRTEGDSIEFLHLNGKALQIAVHHRLNVIDIPDLFQLRNGRFQKCNSEYPQYYQHLLKAQHLSRDSNVAPSLATWFAQLLELGGDSEGAKLQRARASLLSKTGQACSEPH